MSEEYKTTLLQKVQKKAYIVILRISKIFIQI